MMIFNQKNKNLNALYKCVIQLICIDVFCYRQFWTIDIIHHGYYSLSDNYNCIKRKENICVLQL